MKIVAVAACTSGIAHTYIAKQKLIRAAESLGHTIHGHLVLALRF